MALEPSSDELQRFQQADDGRPFVLLQLLRFKEGGRDRYLEYAAAAQPILARIGAQILYAAEAAPPLLAGEGQTWDALVLVRFPRRAAYVEMLDDAGYRAIAPLRQAALREAVLVPTADWPSR